MSKYDIIMLFDSHDNAVEKCRNLVVKAGRPPHDIIVYNSEEGDWNRSVVNTPDIFVVQQRELARTETYIKGVTVAGYCIWVSALEYDNIRNWPEVVCVANPDRAEHSPNFYEYCRSGQEWMLPNTSPTLAGRNYHRWRSVFEMERLSPHIYIDMLSNAARIKSIEVKLEAIKQSILPWKTSNHIEEKHLFDELSYYIAQLHVRSVVDTRFAIGLVSVLGRIAMKLVIGSIVGDLVSEAIDQVSILIDEAK